MPWKLRISLDDGQYLGHEPGWITPFRFPVFNRVNAGSQRLSHLSLRYVELLSNRAYIGNFITSHFCWNFDTILSTNSLFQRGRLRERVSNVVWNQLMWFHSQLM